MTRPTRVVLVEDHDVFRETLELLLGLRDDLEVVGSVAGGREAIELCRRLDPDVVLVDYRMPGLDGAQTTAEILGASPRARVVGLTASITEQEMNLMLGAGAVACVAKDAGLEQIVAAIHEAAVRVSSV